MTVLKYIIIKKDEKFSTFKPGTIKYDIVFTSHPALIYKSRFGCEGEVICKFAMTLGLSCFEENLAQNL